MFGDDRSNNKVLLYRCNNLFGRFFVLSTKQKKLRHQSVPELDRRRPKSYFTVYMGSATSANQYEMVEQLCEEDEGEHGTAAAIHAFELIDRKHFAPKREEEEDEEEDGGHNFVGNNAYNETALKVGTCIWSRTLTQH